MSKSIENLKLFRLSIGALLLLFWLSSYFVGGIVDLQLTSIVCQRHAGYELLSSLPITTRALMATVHVPYANNVSTIFEMLWLLLVGYIVFNSVRIEDTAQYKLLILRTLVLYQMFFFILACFAVHAACAPYMSLAVYAGDSGDPVFDTYRVQNKWKSLLLETLLWLFRCIAIYFVIRTILFSWRRKHG